MEMYCNKCATTRATRVLDTKCVYSIKGYDIELPMRSRVCCVCGEVLWDEQLESANLKNAYRIYREKKGLLQPEEIKAVRERYGLSQTDFARVLGLGDKTITRYENGTVQDESINTLMRIASEAPELFQKLYDENLHKLSGKAREASFERASLAASHPYKANSSQFQNKPQIDGNVYDIREIIKQTAC